MKRSHGACLTVLVLGIFLTATNGWGEEPRSGEVAERTNVQARKALADSIPRRELELVLRQRQEVLGEVKERIRMLGVKASAEELTDLLMQAAPLGIGMDKCSLGLLEAGDCRTLKAELGDVERRFRQAAGVSTREFRSGRRDAPPLADKIGRPSLSKSQTCTCALSVYSGYRWMGMATAGRMNESRGQEQSPGLFGRRRGEAPPRPDLRRSLDRDDFR